MTAHVDRVMEIASSPSAAAQSLLAASWSRSVNKFGLDPGERRAPDRITESQYRACRSEIGDYLSRAKPWLDHLFSLVGNGGCGVLLTNAGGVILDKRCVSGDEQQFNDWGLWDGTIWSEQYEGTNGVGTCLTEERSVSIHREEHFFARNTGITCIDAPIFGTKGELIGALDVSSARFDQTPALNRMIAALVRRTAIEIEVAAFHAAYKTARIVTVASESQATNAVLLAVDRDDIVVGASRGARKRFGLGIGTEFAPFLASDLLNPEAEGDIGFDAAERMAVVQALTRTGNNVSQAARSLGVGRATLYRRMDRLNIDRRNVTSPKLV